MYKLKLIPHWKRALRQFWSIRVALLWGAICGLYGAFGAMQDILSPQVFISLSVFMNVAIVAARITKQPGVEE